MKGTGCRCCRPTSSVAEGGEGEQYLVSLRKLDSDFEKPRETLKSIVNQDKKKKKKKRCSWMSLVAKHQRAYIPSDMMYSRRDELANKSGRNLKKKKSKIVFI